MTGVCVACKLLSGNRRGKFGCSFNFGVRRHADASSLCFGYICLSCFLFSVLKLSYDRKRNVGGELCIH